MGKKRIVKKDATELLKERETVDQKLKKEIAVSAAKGARKGKLYVYSTYNNTIVTLTDEKGNALLWRSAGNIGFKGTKKGTSFAASKVAEAVALACQKLKINRFDVCLKGIGSGRDSALRTLVSKGFEIETIKDITPVPHNGCRPRKPRRV